MIQTVVKNSVTDSCLTLREVSWSQFESLEAAFESVGGIKFAYLDGILEIMTVSPEHEESNIAILNHFHNSCRGNPTPTPRGCPIPRRGRALTGTAPTYLHE
jgi:hypothetical protein